MQRHYLVFAIIIAGLAFFLFREMPKTAKIPHNEAELRALLDQVGPEKAQEIMFKSGLPFTGETHLLFHTVGDYIYEKYGPGGLPYCKDYFLSACYHAFILNDLADHGMEGLVEVMDGCKKAGPGVLPQCAHGAGHGFVAWKDYDLLEALKLCDALGDKVSDFPHFNCYDGVFMENFWGVHGGKPSPKRWVSDTDIYYPCDDPRIPEKYILGCWSNQATSIYQHFKGDLRKTAEACDAVPEEQNRDMCYNNLARQIHPLTQGDAGKVFSLCQAATGKDRQDECVLTNMTSYFSVGDRELPDKICAMAAEPLKTTCFSRLNGLKSYYGESFKDLNATDQYKFLADKAKKDGAEAAWSYLKAAYLTPQGVVGNPHDLAHFIGKLIYESYGLKGLSYCDATFAFGCYHGLMEAAFDAIPPANFPAKLGEAERGCAGSAATSSPSYWSCIHGIGHGVASFRDYNLNPALKDCDTLSKAISTYCHDGVFMEFSRNAPADFYKKNDPLYPCDAISSEYRVACARNQVQVLKQKFNYSNLEVGRACLKTDDPQIKYHCIDAIGYAVAQAHEDDPRALVSECHSIPDQAAALQCLAAAAGELVFQDARGWQDAVKEICGSNQSCWERVNSVKKSYGRN